MDNTNDNLLDDNNLLVNEAELSRLSTDDNFIFVPSDKVYKKSAPAITDKKGVRWYPTSVNPLTGKMVYVKADEVGTIQKRGEKFTLSIKKDNTRCVLQGDSFEDVVQLYHDANPAKLLIESNKGNDVVDNDNAVDDNSAVTGNNEFNQ